jgi:hypothetical protein
MLGGLSLRYRVLMIATAATALMGSFAHEPIKAADLGGDCCADLEDRIAELEATTVRKGNKRVSVTLYGQENHAALFWDDGAEKNTYVVDNNYESSRFGFKGSAKTGFGDWTAGYRLEVEPTGANSARLDQFDDDNADDSVGPRHSFMYLSSKKYGEVRLGLTATPIYNITKEKHRIIGACVGAEPRCSPPSAASLASAEPCCSNATQMAKKPTVVQLS